MKAIERFIDADDAAAGQHARRSTVAGNPVVFGDLTGWAQPPGQRQLVGAG